MEITAAIIILLIAAFLIILGIIGCFAPVLPGPPVAYVSLLLMEFGGVYNFNNLWLVLLGIMTLAIIIIDYFIPIFTTKRFGGSREGVRGSTIGVFIGILATIWLGPLALIVGPFVGAVGGELLAGKTKEEAMRVGVGTLFGFVVGVVGKLLATLVIAITFLTGLFGYIF